MADQAAGAVRPGPELGLLGDRCASEGVVAVEGRGQPRAQVQGVRGRDQQPAPGLENPPELPDQVRLGGVVLDSLAAEDRREALVLKRQPVEEVGLHLRCVHGAGVARHQVDPHRREAGGADALVVHPLARGEVETEPLALDA